MGAPTPRHTRMQDYVSALVQGKYYRALRVVLFALACVLIVLAVFLISPASSQVGRTQQLAASMIESDQRAQVLLIASYDDADNATQMQRDGLVDLLKRSSVGVDVEYLDMDSAAPTKNVSDTSTYGATLANSAWGQALTQKLRDQSYAAVVCIDDEALYYVEAIHDSLFPRTPVVFMGVSDVAHAQHAYELGYVTGLMESCDAMLMVETAKEMQSNATHLVVLTDNTAAGLGERAQFEQAATANSNGSTAADTLTFADLPVTYVNASTISRVELGKQVASAGDDAIVLYLGTTADSAGNAYDASQTAYFVSAAANRPIFSIGFGGVGEGFVASNVVDYEKAGQRAGEIVVAILNGTSPQDIPLETFVSTGMVFDSQVLSTYSISTALPSGAATVNQSGFSLDFLRTIFLPVTLLVLGIACIAAFAYLGYRRTATQMAEVVAQRNTLERRFYTDTLTDMPNMQWLTAYAASDAAKSIRAVAEVALLDLDDIEELHGSDATEKVVKILAKRLNGVDNVFLVRPNQSDFILGFDTPLKRGAAPLDAVESALSHPIRVGERAIAVSPCVGVLNRERGMSLEEMVAGADLAVRQAEPAGASGEVVFYDNDMRLAEEHKLEITALLKKAIENDDLNVLYQPQIDVDTIEVVGYEALVRLRGDKYPPEQFIPIAEANGQIVELDRMVTRKVVQQLATWKKRKQRIRPVSINFSYGQLRDEDYVNYLTSLLDEHGVARKLIRIDIKESLFVNETTRARKFVDELHKAGFSIAIDGFGAGYTAIPHVMQIPADAVKFDRSLTEVFLAGGANDDVIASLVRLVHEARKRVVIEGVETLEQLKMCRDKGCDVVQGFFFSEPLLPERVLRYNPPKVSFPAPAPAPAPDAAPDVASAPDNPAPASDSAPVPDAAPAPTPAAAAPTSTSDPAPVPTPDTASDAAQDNSAPAAASTPAASAANNPTSAPDPAPSPAINPVINYEAPAQPAAPEQPQQ